MCEHCVMKHLSPNGLFGQGDDGRGRDRRELAEAEWFSARKVWQKMVAQDCRAVANEEAFDVRSERKGQVGSTESFIEWTRLCVCIIGLVVRYGETPRFFGSPRRCRKMSEGLHSIREETTQHAARFSNSESMIQK